MSVVRASGLGTLLAARLPAMASSGSEARPKYHTVGDQPAFRKIVRGVWAHLLAYNLVRGAMAEAVGESAAGLVAAALRAIASHRVGDRPDRVEPRVVKRRPRAYPRMQVPRAIARSRLMRAS
jgi:hypothetical protein